MNATTKREPEQRGLSAARATRVIIVDDHELLRQGLTELLENEPDIVVCGQAAGEAEAMLLVRTMNPLVVIVDLSLKDGNGINVIKRIASSYPHVKSIVSSMYDDALYAERALRAGAAGYVNKQQPARTIIDALRQVLDGGLYFSPNITDRVLRRAAGEKLSQQSPLETLSNRELEVFQRIGQGQTTRQIAQQLHLSPRTVETYRERLKTKLKCENASELNRQAVRWALEER